MIASHNMWQSTRRPFSALLAPPCLRRPAATAARATAVAGAGGAGPTTDRHCLSWPLSRQLQRLEVDSGGHCLSRTTPPLSSFTSGLFSEPIQVVEALVFYVLHRGSSRVSMRPSPLSLLQLKVLVHLLPQVLPQLRPCTLSHLTQRVAIGTCSRTGRHLATFTRQPGSSLYTLTTAFAQVDEAGQEVASSQVSASGQLAASCSCRVLSHQTLLWHHRLGHPSLPHLRSMHSHLLRAAPHSSEFPPTTTPLQTLHMDVWGPAPIGGTEQERYFLLVVDDYTRYTTVFPVRRKADVSCVLIPCICVTRHQLRERFSQDFPVLRLHSDRGGEFSFDLLAEFCRDEGIRQTLTLPASPQKNGIAERRIGLIMEVARTSMIHAAAPRFLSPFAVRYTAHQHNLWPRVSEPETSPTLWWTGKVGDASVFRVLGALSLVCDAKASKLSSRTLCCVFLGFPTDALPWQFYHPQSRRVFSSRDVTFDESDCYYRLHPHASHPVPLAPLFLVPVPPR
ncbi:unnamed protein product [Closterium sp. NIES-53]